MAKKAIAYAKLSWLLLLIQYLTFGKKRQILPQRNSSITVSVAFNTA